MISQHWTVKKFVTNDNVRFLTFLVLGFLFLVIFEYEIVRPWDLTCLQLCLCILFDFADNYVSNEFAYVNFCSWICNNSSRALLCRANFVEEKSLIFELVRLQNWTQMLKLERFWLKDVHRNLPARDYLFVNLNVIRAFKAHIL